MILEDYLVRHQYFLHPPIDDLTILYDALTRLGLKLDHPPTLENILATVASIEVVGGWLDPYSDTATFNVEVYTTVLEVEDSYDFEVLSS